ncbi:MAG: Lrp/AsnC family transcriptional regulator [Amylibacter sp.]|jgi:Lrp/AsnC family leucine-responsive transcriptional regulator|tara:strand:- start:8489 stop:8944 length:456 start_codon:yes stop_codon:yes gene_type:complete
MIELDNIDRALLRALQDDGSARASDLGRVVGLSQPAAWRRIKRLETGGVIKGRRALLDAVKLGYGVTVFLGIKLAAKSGVSLEDFERAVSAIPEVQLVQHVLGMYDYRLKVVATDLSDFERVLRRRIMTLPGVGDVEANVLLSEEKRGFAI